MLVVVALLFVFVLVNAVRMVSNTLTPSVSTEVVRMGNMDTQQAIEGIIVRYERVYYAPRAGRVEFLVNEGERVRQGISVARIVDTDAVERLTPYIEDAVDEIRRFNERRHFSEIYPVVERMNTNMHHAVVGSAHSFTAGRLTELNVLFDRLNQLTDNRNQLILDESRDAAGDVGRVHTTLMEQLDQSVANIYATDSGIMFPVIDGHEGDITPQTMRGINRGDVDLIIDSSLLMPVREVEEGEAVFKLVGNTWYIAAHMPHELAEMFTINADRTIYVQNVVTGVYEPLLVRVMHVDRFLIETLVIFRAPRRVTDFLYQRSINIRITEDMATGLKISNTAIATRTFFDIPRTHIHGNASDGFFVHHRSGEFGLIPIPLVVIEETDTHVSVMEESFPLRLGDIIAPVALYTDQLVIDERIMRRVHGVYRANLGYAHFTILNIDGPLSEIDGFTLIDPARNPGLNLFDTIVTNASEVMHGKILD